MTEIPVLYKRKEECCGCTACYAICPKEAIKALNIHKLMRISVCGVVSALKCVR